MAKLIQNGDADLLDFEDADLEIQFDLSSIKIKEFIPPISFNEESFYRQIDILMHTEINKQNIMISIKYHL